MKPDAKPANRQRAVAGVAAAAALAGAGTLALPAAAITHSTATNAFAAVGRGVQVTPDWVLTVQHVAISPNQLYVNGFGTRTVAARYDAPGSDFPANDIALLRLVHANTTAGFLDIAGDALGDADFAPVPVTIASSSNVPGKAAARAYGATTVQQSRVLIDPDDSGPRPAVTANYLVSIDDVVHVQPGDSGGGLFAGQVLDTGVLVGLSSALFTPTDPEGFTGSGFVQPGAYRAWIDAVMQADTTDTDILRWVANPVPEPAIWMLWAGGLSALVVLRRRAGSSSAGRRPGHAADPYFTEQP